MDPNNQLPKGDLDEQSEQSNHKDELESQHGLKDGDETAGDNPGDDVEKQAVKAPEPEKKKDPNLIEWDGPDDPENPMNWPRWRKWTVAWAFGLTTFAATFSSSVFSVATEVTAKEFHVSPEVMNLGTALLLVGYGFGPLVWGPLSEVIGRRYPVIIAMIGLLLFSIPVAVAQNLQTIFVCRFFAGVFACCPTVVAGGALNDFFEPVERGLALTLFAATVFVGPTIAPVIGGFYTQSYLGWRWTQWITCIMAAATGIYATIFLKESFHAILLSRRARKIRFETRNWAIHAAFDERPISVKEFAFKYLVKPFKMVVLEPILLLMTLYLALVYGIIYLLFEALPISFYEQRHFSLGVSSLPFIAVLVGALCGCAFTAWHTVTRFARILRTTGRVIPEERLIPMAIGAVLMPAGMFWFAWTSNPHINPWPSIVALVLTGMGIQMIFQQILNYLVDCYLWQASSAFAINTIARSMVGAGFVMFADGMYDRLGVPWATSLLAFLCVAMIPVPVLFYIYGAKIRKWSKYTPF